MPIIKLPIDEGDLVGTVGSYVFRWEWEDLSVADHFFAMAKSYLGSAVALLQKMIAESTGTYAQALVADFLAEHGTELFFKGVVLQARKTPSGTHDLDHLHREFRNLCPGNQFRFDSDVESFAKKYPDRPDSEFARYPINSQGKSWNVSEHFVLEIWQLELTKLLGDFDRLIPLIKKRYP